MVESQPLPESQQLPPRTQFPKHFCRCGGFLGRYSVEHVEDVGLLALPRRPGRSPAPSVGLYIEGFQQKPFDSVRVYVRVRCRCHRDEKVPVDRYAAAVAEMAGGRVVV